MCERTDEVCGQLQRYSGVCNSNLLDALEIITDINDNLWHCRRPELTLALIKTAKRLLDKVADDLD
jgi:hypothetical protein